MKIIVGENTNLLIDHDNYFFYLSYQRKMRRYCVEQTQEEIQSKTNVRDISTKFEMTLKPNENKRKNRIET